MTCPVHGAEQSMAGKTQWNYDIHVSNFVAKRMNHHLQRAEDSSMIRLWCGHDPNISDHEIAKLNQSVCRAYFSPPSAAHFVWRILWEKVQHVVLRLSPKTARRSIPPNAALATKSGISTSPNLRPATKYYASTSTNVAPGTKSDTPTSSNAGEMGWVRCDVRCEMWCQMWCDVVRWDMFCECYMWVMRWDVVVLKLRNSEVLNNSLATATWLNWSLTELLLYWTVAWLNPSYLSNFVCQKCLNGCFKFQTGNCHNCNPTSTTQLNPWFRDSLPFNHPNLAAHTVDRNPACTSWGW